MRTRVFLSIVIMSLCLSNVISGQKLYISPGGNDTGTGSIDKPLATLNAAVTRSRELRKASEPEVPVE